MAPSSVRCEKPGAELSATPSRLHGQGNHGPTDLTTKLSLSFLSLAPSALSHTFLFKMLSRLGPSKLVPSTSTVARTVAVPSARRTFSARSNSTPPANLAPARLPRSARRVPIVAKPFSSSSRALQAEVVEDGEEPFELSTVERVSDEVDVCIVGGGPAGLSAAIRIMQKAEKEGKEVRVVVLEKGAEIGELILGVWGCRRVLELDSPLLACTLVDC